MIMSFANNINTTEGGTHETGFKSALTKVINDYARKTGMLKEADALILKARTAVRVCPV